MSEQPLKRGKTLEATRERTKEYASAEFKARTSAADTSVMVVPPRTKSPASLALAFAEFAAASFVLLIAPYYSIVSSPAMIDPDIWWHIGVGDWIVANASLPRVGILSQHLERSWVAYSWGFDVMVSTVHRVQGLPGIIGFLICFQILISLAFLLVVHRFARSPLWTCLIAATTIYASYVNPLRPVLSTLLLFTLELFVIFEAERRADDKLLAWLAPIFVLWANLHLQFVYGLFVLVLYAAARVATFVWNRSVKGDAADRPPVMVLTVLGACMLCSCIGPNGILPFKVALDYAADLRAFQVIQELNAINFRRPEHFAQLLLLMIACFVVGRSPRIDLFRPLLLIATAVVSFRAMRDSWFVSMASGVVIAEAIGGSALQAAANLRPKPVVRPAIQYALAATLALGVSFQLASHEGITTSALGAVIDRNYPLRATEFIERAALKGPMYNDFNWGGFLILRLPEYPVSIDPRADLYDPALFTQSLRTANASPGWQQDPDVARANFILIQRWFPLATALAGDTRFRLAYQDHIAAVFVRVSDAVGTTLPHDHRR